MSPTFSAFDSQLSRLSRWRIMVIALGLVGVIATLDYLTGYEVSISIFYLAPVALVAWYFSGAASIAVGVLASLCWLLADVAAGQIYGHPAISLWNTLVRLGFFVTNGLLVAALRNSLLLQRQLARTDALTGLYSRRAFTERLEHDLQLARRQQRPLTIFMFDLDNFKRLNDSQGHPAGDQVLCDTARALQSVSRSSDTVARLGGDEFVMLLPNTNRDEGRAVLAKVQSRLAQALASIKPEVTCSIGVATFERMPSTATEAIQAADTLMYTVKRRGPQSNVGQTEYK